MKVFVEPVCNDWDWTTAGTEDVDDPASFLTLWACAGTSWAGAFAESVPLSLYSFSVGTNAGIAPTPAPMPLQASIAEIRSRSGLTWGQLAAIFSVSRRSLHFWARGARPSSENAERISRVLGIIRHCDRGEPERTRAALFEPKQAGTSVYQLLCEGRDVDALALVAAGHHESRPSDAASPSRRRPPALSSAVRQARRGFAPTELLDARHDAIPALGRPIGAVPIPGLRV